MRPSPFPAGRRLGFEAGALEALPSAALVSLGLMTYYTLSGVVASEPQRFELVTIEPKGQLKTDLELLGNGRTVRVVQSALAWNRPQPPVLLRSSVPITCSFPCCFLDHCWPAVLGVPVALARDISSSPVLFARLSLIVNDVKHATAIKTRFPDILLACSVLDQVHAFPIALSETGGACVHVLRMGVGLWKAARDVLQTLAAVSGAWKRREAQNVCACACVRACVRACVCACVCAPLPPALHRRAART